MYFKTGSSPYPKILFRDGDTSPKRLTTPRTGWVKVGLMPREPRSFLSDDVLESLIT